MLSLPWNTYLNTLLVLHGLTSFGELLITEGVFQGDCLSSAVFCIYLRYIVGIIHIRLAEAMHRHVSDGMDVKLIVTVLAYVDSVVLGFNPEYIDIVWPPVN